MKAHKTGRVSERRKRLINKYLSDETFELEMMDVDGRWRLLDENRILEDGIRLREKQYCLKYRRYVLVDDEGYRVPSLIYDRYDCKTPIEIQGSKRFLCWIDDDWADVILPVNLR
jgi:hypothetical protein